MRLTKLAIVLSVVPFLLTSCATMFRGSRPDVEIVSSANVKVEGAGGPAQVYRDEGGIVVHPDVARTDSLRISYGGQSTTVALAKNASGLEILNLLSFGIGFTVDDLSHSWFNYSPVYVTVDSGPSGVTAIHASSTNWLGETPGKRDLHGLLLFGTGYSFQTGSGNNIPFLFSDLVSPLISIQAGIGIDYKKKLELLYLFRSESSYGISSDGETSAEIDGADLCLRWFFQKNLFIQGSYGRGYATSNYYYSEVFDPETGTYTNTNNPSVGFNEAGAAIGWAGDISYIALQYFTGLNSFNLNNYTNIQYHTVYLDFGLNFQL
ncbi:MAG TPA: hypothetical protein VGM92_11870 [Candidatus Kapabacteria bacterium]|jgi:hypothetical protein